MKEYLIKAIPENSGMRLDMLLMEFIKNEGLGLSRTSLQELFSEGMVFSCEDKLVKPHYKIKGYEAFRLRLKEVKPSGLAAEDIILDVVYEDCFLAVINKRSGMVVHPAPGNYEHTLVNALLHRFAKLSDINPERPGIVHRLDKETSGLMVVALDNGAHLGLAEQFAEHSIKRKYVAVVTGKMEFDEHVIELPLDRHPLQRNKRAVSYRESAKYAKTHYRTLKRSPEYSVVELTPFTGRTHQLRVHLASIGHPILGDKVYGKNNAFSRLMLHAKYLGFIHPVTGKFLEFDSRLPSEFQAFLKK